MTRDRGSVRYHRGGWEIRLQHEGRRLTRRVPGDNNRAGRRAAEAALDDLTIRILAPDATTVAELLVVYEATRSAGWSASTRSSHRVHVAPILEAIAGVDIARLTAVDLEVLYARWRAAGTSHGTVIRRHSILAAALRYAERHRMIAISPARHVEHPAPPRREEPEMPELSQVLAAVARLDHRRLRTIAELALATGARRGELIALRWSDVDLDLGVVKIAASVSQGPDATLVRGPRKAGGVLRLSIDEATVAGLRSWRTDARAAALAAGHGRLGDQHPVVPAPSDPRSPWRPDRVTNTWVKHRASIGLPTLRFHDLRHVHATALLASGMPVHDVAARLGNTPAMIHGVYGHAMPAADQRAAAVVAEARRPTA